MDLDAVAEALRTAVATTDAQGFSEVPSQLTPPAAVIGIGKGDYADSEDHMTVQFGILVLLSTSDPKGAQKKIRSYVAAHGANSIKAAVETIPDVDVLCRGWDPPAIITIGGLDYLGLEFSCEVVE